MLSPLLCIVGQRSVLLAALAAGTFVMAGAMINPDVTVGKGEVISTGACVDHDCSLADGVHDCTGASLAGNIVVGDRSWIGIGACPRYGVPISRDVTFGAGACVTAEVADRPTVVRVPARPMIRSVPAG